MVVTLKQLEDTLKNLTEKGEPIKEEDKEFIYVNVYVNDIDQSFECISLEPEIYSNDFGESILHLSV